MELTWLAAASLLVVGVGYAVLQRAQQSPFVVWTLLGATLFVLSTRDLLRSRRRPGAGTPRSGSPDRARSEADDSEVRPALLSRFRRRVDGWLT